MDHRIHFNIHSRQYKLKCQYSNWDKISVFFERIRKAFALCSIGFIFLMVLVIAFSRLRSYKVFLSFYKSFFVQSSQNLLIFLFLFLSIFLIYFAFKKEDKNKPQIDVRHLFAKDFKRVFDSSAQSTKGAIPKNMLLHAIKFKKGLLASKLEISLSEFEKKIEQIPVAESFSNSKSLFELIVKRTGEKRITIYDFVWGLIHMNEMYKNIFFEFNIDEEDLFYYLSLLSSGEGILYEKQKLFSAALVRSGKSMNKAFTAKKTSFLDSVCTDMTLQAKHYKYPFIIGREKELEDVIRILKMDRYGVLLFGKAGIGKSSISQGLAYLMASENVPKVLQDKRLMLVNVGLLTSSSRSCGTKNGIVGLLEEANSSGNIVFVFDDIAHLVGTEKQSESGAMDAFSILSNYITNHNVKVIGSITPKDYSKYIQTGSSSSARHLETVEIKELSRDDIFKILLLKSYELEKELRIRVSILAIKSVYELASRYGKDTTFPTKGITLLKESIIYAKENNQKTLTSELVAELVSKKTNMKLTSVTQKESERLLAMEDQIHKRLVGQDDPVRSVSAALRRARLNLHDQTKTIANFLFLGPTGVGKTELAKSLAEIYFENEKNMVRFDMSEYQEKRSIAKLIGDPSEGGFGGYLTESVRQKPFCLLLLDELEKAHPDIFNIFLQVMDDGRLTDAFGETVDFTNVILIATSNVGSLDIQKYYKEGLSSKEIRDKMMKEELLKHFKPEFLNRFDDIAVFHPLTEMHVQKITHLLLKELKNKLFRQRIHLKWDDDFVAQFVEKHFSFEMGARPIRRGMQEEIGNVVAEKMLAGELSKNQTVFLKGDKVEIK